MATTISHIQSRRPVMVEKDWEAIIEEHRASFENTRAKIFLIEQHIKELRERSANALDRMASILNESRRLDRIADSNQARAVELFWAKRVIAER